MTLLLTRYLSRVVEYVDVVTQEALVLILAKARAHVWPVVAAMLAVIQRHAVFEVCEVSVVGVDIIMPLGVASRAWCWCRRWLRFWRRFLADVNTCAYPSVKGTTTSMQELNIIREQRAMFVAVHVETSTRSVARFIASEVTRVDVVSQAALLVLLAAILALVAPITAILAALLD